MITLVSDGAYSSKHKMGGWACLVCHGDYIEELSGHVPMATNNRMELQAVIEGFEHIIREFDRPMPIVVITDSAYVYKAMTERWPERWDFRNWRTSAGEMVKNRDLWERLWELQEPFNINWTHTRGHAGNELNERADKLAVAAREAGHLAAMEATA